MKERILRALGILFAVALIAGGILTAVIAEEAPTVSIEYFTLSHENAVYIEYAVDYRGFDGVPADTGMLYWTKEPVKPELGTEDSRSGMLGYDEINGQKYYIFKYANLTAAQMCDDIWACAYATVGERTYYSDVEKYSVETYAARKLGLVPGVEGTKDETLKDLLRAMLEYGEKAQKHFKDARQDIYPTDILHPVTVTFDADNGTTPTAQTVWRNRKPTKPADPTKDGYTFAGWRNGDTEWNFDTDTVTDDVTLTAHWDVAVRYSEGLSFDSNGDGTCSVSGIGTCTDTELNIPPVALDNERVTQISNCAFQFCRNLTKVTIPDGVKYIGGSAFEECKSLTSINLPEGLTYIESSAFQDCENLTDIILPGSLTSINDYTFSGCKSLTSITLPEGLTTIGNGAFIGCNLKNITLPKSLTYIGNRAFVGCSNLSSIRIPAGVTYIGTAPLCGCSGLTSIKVEDGNTKYHAVENCLIQTDTQILLSGCKNSRIPADGSVKSIGRGAFADCNDLSDIVIPSTVTQIEGGAFNGCNKLIQVENSISYVGKWVVGCAYSATSVTLRDDTVGIADYAFYNCKQLTQVTIPSGVKNIGTDAFSDCNNLIQKEGGAWYVDKWVIGCDTSATNIKLRNGTVGIADRAFYNHSALTDITIPSGVIIVGNWAFASCNNLMTAVLPNSVTHIGNWAFWDCRINYIAFPSNLVSIGNGAFYSCSNAAVDYNIPSKVISVGNFAFAYCRMTGISIPNSVTYIGKGAFFKCNDLKYIELPFVGSTPNGTVNTHFGYIFGADSNTGNAYYVPKSLTKVSFRGTAKDFTIDENAFYGLTGVTVVQEFQVRYNYDNGSGGWINYVSKGSHAIKPTDPTKDGYRLVGWFYGDREWNFDTDTVTEDMVLTARWTEISTSKGLNYTSNGDGTCYLSGIGSCKDSDLNIPSKSPAGDRVTGIGNWAFNQCGQLTSVIIPDSMTTIGERAFNGCSNLTYIVIPNSVTSIGVYAFAYCNLEEIAFPDSVTQIGDDILNSCNNLKRITVDPNNPVYRAAGNCLIDRRNGVLLVGCQNSVIPTDGSVTSIYVFAFYKCEGLKSIVIPKGVTSIGYEAFYYCTNLTSVTISDSVTSFAFEAFRGCSNLTTINYEGTMEQWNSIEKADSWDKFIDSYTVHCTDGDIVKS